MQGFVAAVRGVENSLGTPEASRISTVFMDVSWYVAVVYVPKLVG